MKFIKTNSQNNMVMLINNMPFDPIYGLGKTEEELLAEGFLVEEVPDTPYVEGKSSILHYSNGKGFWFDYVDCSKTPEQIQAEKLDQLENQTAEYMVDLDFRLSNIELGL